MFQFYNSVRVQDKGFGERLNIRNFKSDELILALNKIMEVNSTHRMNIQRTSQIYKSQPLIGKELAGYWVDHVLKFGSKHFRSQAFDIPLYEYLLIDVLSFLLLVIVSIIFLVFICIRTIAKLVFKNSDKQKIS